MTTLLQHTWASDTSVYPKLLDLTDCLCQTITQLNLPQPCFCGVLPGLDVAMNYVDPSGCSETQCGMAWTRLRSIQAAGISGFGQPTAVCPGPMSMVFELGIVRCAPVGSADGDPPTVADYLDVTDLQMADQQAMVRAVACCFGNKGWSLDLYTPIGPLGGVVGGMWFVTVEQD